MQMSWQHLLQAQRAQHSHSPAERMACIQVSTSDVVQGAECVRDQWSFETMETKEASPYSGQMESTTNAWRSRVQFKQSPN